MSFSRSRTRRHLLQTLYARSVSGDSVSQDAPFFDDVDRVDTVYFYALEKAILQEEGKLLSVIYKFAPKYDIKTVPIVNALILLIALAELLVVCPPDVPEKVSINEAIELAKRYSDDAGKNLINGVLNGVITQKTTLLHSWKTRASLQYSFFH